MGMEVLRAYLAVRFYRFSKVLDTKVLVKVAISF